MQNERAPQSAAPPRSFGILLLTTAVIGWIAAFNLTLDKFRTLENPDAILSCDISILVQCGANLDSAQGSIFGFPNPLIGVTGWAIVAVVGVIATLRVELPRWFWLGFLAGMTFALGFVIWLISQSIFVLGTLCPWCMVTWAVTIPAFFGAFFVAGRLGVFGERARAVSARLYGWTPLIAFAAYLIIAVIAQLRLDVIARL